MSDKLKAFRERIEKQDKIQEKLSSVKHIIAVMSGKGGVGKSTVTANIAVGLALKSYKVGVLDSDFHGPSIPKILGVENLKPTVSGDNLIPVNGPLGVKILSIEFFLKEKETPVIWRGPMKFNILRQLLTDTEWGELDYLLIDLPPGTGDEPLSVMQLIPSLTGVIIVTHPTELSEIIVNKSGNMAKQLGVRILGVIENMSSFKCPVCNTEHNIFGVGGGEHIAKYLKVPLLAKIPIEPKISLNGDLGKTFITVDKDSPATQAYLEIVDEIIKIT
ncbi:MAG: Mrp/NBP35 family ATP-binding protein [Candidatus Odinarchaeia archaeon]